jgi:hypothetical protein
MKLPAQPYMLPLEANRLTGLFLSAVLFFASTALHAQKQIKEFAFTLPEATITNSLYNSIELMDSRHDTSNFGIVQLGAFNRKVQVVAATPLAAQLQQVMTGLIDSTAKNGSLLLQLRQFSFAEITGAMSEKGYFYLRAELYAKNGDRYTKKAMVDTVVLVKTLDVTKALLRNGSRSITDFVAANLTTEPAAGSPDYSLGDIAKIDSIEKITIPAYSSTKYPDGIYTTFNEFKTLSPAIKEITVELNKNNRIASLKSIDPDGKKFKVKSKDIYAVVYNGQLYIATDYGYYPVEKQNNDLYFTGRAKVTANTGDVLAASFFFGVLGGLIASDASATFLMKIDHINGGFIRIKEMKAVTE